MHAHKESQGIPNPAARIESDFSVSGCLLSPPETHPDPVSGRFVALRPYLRKRRFGMPKGGVTTRKALRGQRDQKNAMESFR